MMKMYICDRKACGEFCPNCKCTHTSDKTHAINGTNANKWVIYPNIHLDNSEGALWWEVTPNEVEAMWQNTTG